jgi:hypothetical protein
MAIGNVTNVNETSIKTIKLVAAAARSVGDPVEISTGNATHGVNNDASLSDNTNVKRVAVAMQSAASGAVYEAAVEGTVTMTVPSATYTKGNAIKYFDGTMADSGAVAGDSTGEVGDNVVGTILEGGTTVTSIKVTLLGKAVTKTT